jgi:hypothetical protein
VKQTENIRCVEQVVTDRYAIYQGDCIDLIRAMPDASVHYGLHSPPFSGLYKFSNFDRDLSNSEDGAFFEHYGFLIHELRRVTMPGRLHSVHCMQLPTSINRDGAIGMRDFRGEIVRAYVDAGWIFHSEICIRKDPVAAMARSKSHRLLHKQMVKDSTISGQALADYVVNFRKPGENIESVAGALTEFVGDPPLDLSREAWKRDTEGRAHFWPYEQWVSILIWQRYAEPIWTDINQQRTLQYRAGRDEKDETHIAPLQLDVIERCMQLWSNPGDTVLTPFLGIGSEVYAAVEMGRRGIGFELKPSYFTQAAKNLREAVSEATGGDLLALAAGA